MAEVDIPQQLNRAERRARQAVQRKSKSGPEKGTANPPDLTYGALSTSGATSERVTLTVAPTAICGGGHYDGVSVVLQV